MRGASRELGSLVGKKRNDPTIIGAAAFGVLLPPANSGGA